MDTIRKHMIEKPKKKRMNLKKFSRSASSSFKWMDAPDKEFAMLQLMYDIIMTSGRNC